MKNRYTPAFLVFMLIVVVFLLLQNIAIISNQRKLLKESTRQHVGQELDMLSAAVLESLLIRDYVAVENFLQQWGKEEETIVSLSAVSTNGFTLAEYKKNITHAKVLETLHVVSHKGRDLITLKLVHDLSATHQKLLVFSLGLGLASTFFMVIMGLTLWYSIKKMAIIPLEEEILLRIQTEDSLHGALDEVEQKKQEIDNNRNKLKTALGEISSLIQQATKEKNLGVRFYNPNLPQCYKVLSCNDQECPFYGKEGRRCWEEQGSLSLGKEDYCCREKGRECTRCPVYRKATDDPVYQIGEQFNQMMHILEEKNRELEEAYTELKATQSQILQREKMASVGLLAAGVAHEINNPIGFVSSNLTTLEKYLKRFEEFIALQADLLTKSADDEGLKVIMEQRRKLKLDYISNDAHELIAESLDGTTRVSKIVQGLKSFSRVDQEKHMMADINECLESTLNIVWNELKYKAEVSKDYGDLPLINCYPQQLNQVFMNILVNAGHAIEEKGKITIRTWADENFIHVAISDTGTGIDEEHLERLFEPFFTTKEVGSGTGLGLSIAYDIITKEHGGELTVDSRVGEGTTFTVKIPIISIER